MRLHGPPAIVDRAGLLSCEGETMAARLHLFWERVHSSYWFLPGLLLAAAAGLAFLATWSDRNMDQEWLRGLTGVFSGGPEGARAVLGATATAVLGVAGTTFSITIAVLSLTSSQFGPRLLRNFLKDTGNQIVLGTFIGTFLYSLLVLRTVRSIDESPFVPHLAVTVGLVLAVVSVGMLVYFIQHIVTSIQASRIIAVAGKDLLVAVERLFPSRVGAPAAAATEPAGPMPGRSVAIRAARSGYVQAIDAEALLSFASERAGVTELLKMPGEFVAAGTPLARWYASGQPDATIDEGVNDAFTLGEYPTQTQDAMFSVHQLTEIATRALSPGVNDPKTAMICLDWLSVGLCVLAAREFPSWVRRDDDGAVRLVAKVPSFESLLDSALDQIRRYGRSDAEVLTRLLHVLAEVASCARPGPRRAALRRHADLVRTEAEEGLTAEEAKVQVMAHHRMTIQAIDGADGLTPA
jgi:uncharacterized membrane protein